LTRFVSGNERKPVIHDNTAKTGAMKKAGYTVESFKSDKGERSYRINP